MATTTRSIASGLSALTLVCPPLQKFQNVHYDPTCTRNTRMQSSRFRHAARSVRAFGSIPRTSVPTYPTLVGKRFGFGFSHGVIERDRRVRNVRQARSFSAVTDALRDAKEDAPAMAVVRKVVVDGPLPARSVSFLPASGTKAGSELKQPVAVLIGFLESTPKYLKRHAEIYNERGIDALIVCPTYKNVLWPETGKELARAMLKALDIEGFSDRPLIVHGFSAGGYMYGNMLLFSQQSGASCLRSRVVGQVMDSAVDMNGIPKGVPQVMAYQLRGDPFALPWLRTCMEQLIHLYLWLTHRYTTVPYSESSQALHNNTVLPPSLLVYSTSDLLARVEDNAAVAGKWREKGADVTELVLENSGHCQHLRKNPEKYRAAVHSLLDKVHARLEQREA